MDSRCHAIRNRTSGSFCVWPSARSRSSPGGRSIFLEQRTSRGPDQSFESHQAACMDALPSPCFARAFYPIRPPHPRKACTEFAEEPIITLRTHIRRGFITQDRLKLESIRTAGQPFPPIHGHRPEMITMIIYFSANVATAQYCLWSWPHLFDITTKNWSGPVCARARVLRAATIRALSNFFQRESPDRTRSRQAPCLTGR